MKFDIINIQARIKNTLMETLGIVFIETDDALSVEAFMPVTTKLTQTMGVMHGGATISLAESVAGVGSNLLCAPDERCLGMQISANHLNCALVGDTVKAKACIIHKGRTSHVWNVDVISETTGKLISTLRVTNAVVKKIRLDS